ncbi:hypothetical protein Thini_4541 [Thiothrix nivea DSM 5205]|uniref:Uncharacterized protein n=1 Tax=Thiothrix nivea (strain ATCC 35100 / DSM 5205 / JP2) TaxID=870187 RepID=A0A656HKJ2_THINJ|nr:hypothetical protein Thini_4541 [Thiothrix nivea DSM 5205]
MDKYKDDLKKISKKRLHAYLSFFIIFMMFFTFDMLNIKGWPVLIAFFISFIVFGIFLARALLSYCPRCGILFFGIAIQRKSCINCNLSLDDH